ncbi:Verify 3D Structural Homology [Encephalitozoon hellem]|uniref:Verify 3D Structural Homology n=1 Tax=Encephalitozoon hellem TaxID=27973 RepID=A0A9Q9C2T0_ENCHE|nr:Verify 3D Structural Homology [Encephalitozoon hellem]
MDMFEEMIEDIEGSQIIENMNYLVGKYSYDNGMVGRIIGKIEDLGIGSVCIGLAVVVAVHCIIWGGWR